MVKYLCERGGERLLMLTDNVSALHMLCVACCMHLSFMDVCVKLQ